MDDLINRQDAIDVVRKCHVKEVTPAYMLIDKSEIMTELMMLPSAEPNERRGKWVHDNPNTFRCSECNKYLDIGCGNMKMNFCPNCGADMRGKEND